MTVCTILQIAPLDLLETIAVLHVPILVLEHSVIKRVVARGHYVIIPMDAVSSHQVPLVKRLMIYILPFLFILNQIRKLSTICNYIV